MLFGCDVIVLLGLLVAGKPGFQSFSAWMLSHLREMYQTDGKCKCKTPRPHLSATFTPSEALLTFCSISGIITENKAVAFVGIQAAVDLEDSCFRGSRFI